MGEGDGRMVGERESGQSAPLRPQALEPWAAQRRHRPRARDQRRERRAATAPHATALTRAARRSRRTTGGSPKDRAGHPSSRRYSRSCPLGRGYVARSRSHPSTRRGGVRAGPLVDLVASEARRSRPALRPQEAARPQAAQTPAPRSQTLDRPPEKERRWGCECGLCMSQVQRHIGRV